MLHSHTNTRIKKLSPLLINQLAAGEVVTRPAAVVKELLENAIDAHATDIEVRITQGGMGMIEVIDNGVGIHPDDMVMAVTRHATSKVADVAHLHGITTLGFRGEALAATAAVSRLILTSSHDSSGIGRQLQVAGILGDTPKLIPVVHHRGTTITVRDLYFNVPARRGNLKSIATEFGHIETIVREVALARADVALTLFHDNKKRLSLSVNTINKVTEKYLPLSRLEQATGLALTEQAIEVAVDLSSLTQQFGSSSATHANDEYADNVRTMQPASIGGWLWASYDANHSLPKLIYVNGRLVKEALISNQLRQMVQSVQLAGMGYALYFELPTQWLNVNVHPSKQRIKISPLNNIMAHLSHAIRAKLRGLNTAKIVCSKKVTPIPSGHTSTKQSFNTSNPIASSTNSVMRGQQVQAPKQPYQLSENESLFESIKDLHIDEPIEDSRHAVNSYSVKTPSLPVCLEVIDSITGLVESTARHGIDDKALPWLLFYHQGQCALISAERWQSRLKVLFESTIFSSTMYDKAKVLNSTTINQQLAKIIKQMSSQDAQAFVADMEAILSKYAIHSIDSHQLVTLMLSSALK